MATSYIVFRAPQMIVTILYFKILFKVKINPVAM